jgi:uncharacterized membrane protein
MVIFIIQMTFFGMILLEYFGIHLPYLLQIIGFIFLTFIPGILILRILKLHKLSDITVPLYTIGLSLATLIFTGFCINLIFPLYGVSRPISLWPLIFSINIIVVILSFFAYSRDRSYSSFEYIHLEEIIAKPVLPIFLFPFIAIGGAYLFNADGNNGILMIILPLIAFVPIIILFTESIQDKYFPIIIFILAITLLYSRSLISTYIWGWDINSEYYFTNIVIENGVWDLTFFGNLNAMLSLTMLGPIYSIMLSMDLDKVFKIIYPLIFAFVPLGLYAIFQKLTEKKVAFLACYFFISFFVFFNEMLQLARQEIAELFLVLIILSTIDSDLNKFSKSIFFLLFSSSLVVSHYGLSYLYLIILLITSVIAIVGYHLISQKYVDQIFVWFSGKPGYRNEIDLKKYFFSSGIFSFAEVFYYCGFLLIWYIYISGSSSFRSLITIGSRIISGASTEFLNPETTQGLALIKASDFSIIHEISKDMQILTILLIIIGFLGSVVLYKKIRINFRYLLLSFGALCLCAGGLILPYFSSSLNTSRVYQICLIFLAPFCIIGGIIVFQILIKFLSTSHENHCNKISLQILSVFFAVFLLFNSSWIYEISNDQPSALLNNAIDAPIVNVQQVAGAVWLTDKSTEKSIFVDTYRQLFFIRIFGKKVQYITDPNKMPQQSYIFLGNFNIVNNNIYGFDPSFFLTNRSLIYDSGGAEVFYR